MSSFVDAIPVLAARNGWLAVDKPCGLSVHNHPGHDLGSVLAHRIRTDSSQNPLTDITQLLNNDFSK